MLMQTDPFGEFDRWTQQMRGPAARPAVMLMDAWREGDRFIVEFDLPGVQPESFDLDVDNHVLTVRAERTSLDQNKDLVAAERQRGVFSRQLLLAENLDVDRIEASYHDGVLRLVIPIAEHAKPRRIEISRSDEKKPINA
jgi:HSP20 family protein